MSTTTDRFLGDGTPSSDGDTRVRCWFCRHYTHNLQIPLWKHDDVTGEMRKHWLACRTCSKGLGHDPFILRRCEAFRCVSPQYRVKLPEEAFKQGWRALYGDDDYDRTRERVATL